MRAIFRIELAQFIHTENGISLEFTIAELNYPSKWADYVKLLFQQGCNKWELD